jgi:hypothetical protein
MSAWPFIIAAYAISLVATLALTMLSWLAMHRAENDAARIGREQ